MLGGNGYIFAISITRIHASGESTASLSTANQSKTLRDGVQLFLTVALGADRAGRTYDSPIIPDQLVTSDWTLFQTERDLVLLTAVAWLKGQPLERNRAQGV